MDIFQYYRYAAVLLTVFFVGWGCLLILHPFIPAMLLGLIFCLATWPAFIRLEKHLGGRKGWAAFLMTLFLFLSFLVPLIFLGSSLGEGIIKLNQSIDFDLKMLQESPPNWLGTLPFVGAELAEKWTIYTRDTQALFDVLSHHAKPFAQHVLALAAKMGEGLFDLTLGIVFAFFFLMHGSTASDRLHVLLDRLAGVRGEHLLKVSKDTLISVIYGILGTALIQGVLAAIGFWIARIPSATVLGFLTFVLSLIPGGTPFVWAPVTVWLFLNGQVGLAIFVGLWGFLLVSSIDNFIRPYFISLGTDLPLLLILLGVFGGILAFGFIGLFIGPTLLALAYALLGEWSERPGI